MKEDHWDGDLPRELDRSPVIGVLRRAIEQIDSELAEGRNLTPEAFGHKWQQLCPEMLRVWDLFEQLMHNTYENGLLELEVGKSVAVSHRLPAEIDHSLLPHALWLIRGETTLTEFVNRCSRAIPIDWRPHRSNTRCTRYLPFDDLVKPLNSHCPMRVRAQWKPTDITGVRIDVHITALTQLYITLSDGKSHQLY